jgi:hypothetical protein
MEDAASTDNPSAIEKSRFTAVVVKSHIKEFKDSNFNVTKAIFSLFLAVWQVHQSAAIAPDSWIWKDAVRLAIGKISDKKLGEDGASVILELCVVRDPVDIVPVIIKSLETIKTPASHQAVLIWFQRFIDEFGSSALRSTVNDVVKWLLAVSAYSLIAGVVSFGSHLTNKASSCLQECQHSNPQVRKAALALAGAMHSQLGPPFKSLVLSSCNDSMSKSVKDQIEESMEKQPYDKDIASRDRPRKCITTATGHTSSQSNAAQGASFAIPRFELLNSLPEDLLDRMVRFFGLIPIISQQVPVLTPSLLTYTIARI